MKNKALLVLLIGMSIAALFVTGCGEVGPTAPTSIGDTVGTDAVTPMVD